MDKDNKKFKSAIELEEEDLEIISEFSKWNNCNIELFTQFYIYIKENQIIERIMNNLFCYGIFSINEIGFEISRICNEIGFSEDIATDYILLEMEFIYERNISLLNNKGRS